MSNPPVYAITGSNGYVGSCIKNCFTARGWKTLELTRTPLPGTGGIAFQLGGQISPSALSGIDALVHCAYDLKLLRWEEIHSINVLGTEKLFQAARVAGVKKIVCISSISAYPGCRSLYGRAKLEIEKIARAYGALIIRPGLVYGGNTGGMFGKLVSQVQRSSIIPLIGNGSQDQFLLDQEDLSAFIAHYVADEMEISSCVVTAAHERPIAFKQLLLEIAGRLDKKVKFIPVPWQLVWAILRTGELCGLKINFRSDSLLGLVYHNPQVDFSTNAAIGLVCLPFDADKLHL